MKQIEFSSVGRPEEVVRYAEAEMPPNPAAGEVLVKVLAFPVNPADLLTLQGVYPPLDTSTNAIGNEAIGVISAVGDGVRGLAVSDRVILLGHNNWREYRLVRAAEVLKISADGDILQQAGLKVNPATAALLLQGFVELGEGEWLVQNAANSAVGRSVIQLARLSGIKTVNVVRRADVVEELRGLGASVVLQDGDDLPRRIQAATGDAPIKLGIDSVGGPATDRLASCLDSGAMLVVYGAMSGAQSVINPGTLVFRDIRIRGFWLSKHLNDAPRETLAALYGRLDELAGSGRLVTSIDSVFPAHDIANAVRRASQAGIGGKVLVAFDTGVLASLPHIGGAAARPGGSS